jgi:hypothetical protein
MDFRAAVEGRALGHGAMVSGNVRAAVEARALGHGAMVKGDVRRAVEGRWRWALAQWGADGSLGADNGAIERRSAAAVDFAAGLDPRGPALDKVGAVVAQIRALRAAGALRGIGSDKVRELMANRYGPRGAVPPPGAEDGVYTYQCKLNHDLAYFFDVELCADPIGQLILMLVAYLIASECCALIGEEVEGFVFRSDCTWDTGCTQTTGGDPGPHGGGPGGGWYEPGNGLIDLDALWEEFLSKLIADEDWGSSTDPEHQ